MLDTGYLMLDKLRAVSLGLGIANAGLPMIDGLHTAHAGTLGFALSDVCT